jgi:hypothetical protein
VNSEKAAKGAGPRPTGTGSQALSWKGERAIMPKMRVRQIRFSGRSASYHRVHALSWAARRARRAREPAIEPTRLAGVTVASWHSLHRPQDRHLSSHSISKRLPELSPLDQPESRACCCRLFTVTGSSSRPRRRRRRRLTRTRMLS